MFTHQFPFLGTNSSYTRKSAAHQSTAGRNLVVCLDGTDNEFGSTITNIPTIFSFLSADPSVQLNYYQGGVGTYEKSNFGIFNSLATVIDLAVGYSLDEHVRLAYRFLVNTYQPGDKIFIFGFSRGAYTAKALAGFLDVMGLLLAHSDDESIKDCYKIYKNSTRNKDKPAGMFGKIPLTRGYRETFSRTVTIDFLGCFDTVASIGALLPRTLPYSAGPGHIKIFRQALALDERRARFIPQLWEGSRNSKETDVKEVWFAGSHCNVGGGANVWTGEIEAEASHIPLVWMIREAMAAGLILDGYSIRTSSLYVKSSRTSEPSTTDPSEDDHEKSSPEEESAAHLAEVKRLVKSAADPFSNKESSKNSFFLENFVSDALAPHIDALDLFEPPAKNMTTFSAKFYHYFIHTVYFLIWWTIEILPLIRVDWDDAGKTLSWTIRPNYGRGRLMNTKPWWHESVRIRMEKSDYKPDARFAGEESIDDVVFVI